MNISLMSHYYLINPLLHFVTPEVCLISSENLRFSASGGPLGGPPKSPSELVFEFRWGVRGTPRGPPDAEYRRFSELTCDSENEVSG